jgi:sulfatase maturation enzyme AslB (radical SAM superfamily)
MAFSVCLYLTEKCNLGCKYCFIPNKNQLNMTLEIAKLAIDLGIRCHYKDHPLNFTFFGMAWGQTYR